MYKKCIGVVVADETNGNQKIIAYNLSQEKVSEYRLSDDFSQYKRAIDRSFIFSLCNLN